MKTKGMRCVKIFRQVCYDTLVGRRKPNDIHYSKYHLHRMFVQTVGMTIHDCIQCRQLTEGIKLLVFSDKPILEIALKCGYESQ